MFLGLLVSSQEMDKPRRGFAESMAEPNDYAVIFSKRCTTKGLVSRSCGPLLHSVLGEYKISEAALLRAQKWLTKKESSPSESRLRATMAARWVNHAASSRDPGKFLFFFFALDALFGERFQVETKIVDGVAAIMSAIWGQKCEWLFDLRSELVHGGAVSIDDWIRADPYRDHFQSKPAEDIETLAATCLMEFFD